MKKRIAITGMGAVTPIGNSVDSFWENLLAGHSGVGPVTLFDTSDYPTKIAAEVKDFNGADYFDRKDLRMMARAAQFGAAAALMARDHGKWASCPGEGPLGVVGGISNSSQDAVEPGVETIQKRGYRRVLPTVLNQAFPHSTASEAGRLTGFQDHVITLSTGCTAGFNALAYAVEQISEQRCTSMICISTDATISNYVFGFFCRSGMLSTSTAEPATVSRPFDAGRDGGVLGEGAAAFLLEDMDQAIRRKARIWAEILSCASSGIGYQADTTAIGQGMVTAMRNALVKANTSPEQIDYLGCHGVSDPKLDAWETAAIKQVFGDHAYRLPMSSIKSMIGIPQNAAGLLQAVATIRAMNEGIIPATINYENPDPACDLDYVPNHPRRNKLRLTMVFGHGFNGSDAALILKKYDDH